MSAPAVIIVGLIALGVVNLTFAFRVRRMLRRPVPRLIDDSEAPPALVLLCLRGGDPFLDRSLRRLFSQDYPTYRVRIVLDSAIDSAREYVDAVLREMRPPNVEVMVLGERFDTCTYKMSAILWGTRAIPVETRLVALMDGDTVPHPTWLRELATPLVRDGAACSTGNRWYFPERPTLGAMVRVCWGAGALITMALHRIPWGGTMAVRRDILENDRLRERLQGAFSEDTTIGQFVTETGGHVVFDPRLMIVNHEDVSLRGFLQFDTRQLLAVRLQHRAWMWAAVYGCSGTPLVAYPLARLLGLGASLWCDLTFVGYFFSYAVQAVLFGPVVRRMLHTRGETLAQWNLRRMLLGLLSVPVVQCIHLTALIRAVAMRTVSWRGVHYRIATNPRLRVIGDDAPPTAPVTTPLARSA